MQFSISKRELFALTRHLMAQQSPTPEHGRKRLRLWDELRVADLADQLSGFGGQINVTDWLDKTLVEVEWPDWVIDWVASGLAQPKQGEWADILTRLGDRLEAAKK